MEPYDVIVYASAQEDIREAVRYLADTLLERDTAHDLLLRFRKELLSLSAMPERFPLVPDQYLASYGFRTASVGNHLIFFTVRKKARKVDVVRVLYARRNWAELIKREI